MTLSHSCSYERCARPCRALVGALGAHGAGDLGELLDEIGDEALAELVDPALEDLGDEALDELGDTALEELVAQRHVLLAQA